MASQWSAQSTPPAATQSSLTLADVGSTLSQIKDATGPGSKKAKAQLLHDMLAEATVDEQDFLRRLLVGSLRQGALEGIMMDAVAAAADVNAPLVRRAAMVTGDLALIARHALAGGAEALGEFGLELFTPLQPMLAQTAESVTAAIDKIGEAAIEWKVDGARVQVHRSGDEVRVFTRNLRDITSSVPEIVRLVKGLDVDSSHLGRRGRRHPLRSTTCRIPGNHEPSLNGW